MPYFWYNSASPYDPTSIKAIVTRSDPGALSFNSNTKKLILPPTLNRLSSLSGYFDEIIFPENLTIIDDFCFTNFKVPTLDLSKTNLQYLGNLSFHYYCMINTIVFPPHYFILDGCQFKNINSYPGYGDSKIICTSTQPYYANRSTFALNGSTEMFEMFSRNWIGADIYVPDEALEAYLTAPGWEDVAHMIKPMTQLPTMGQGDPSSQNDCLKKSKNGQWTFQCSEPGDVRLFNLNGQTILTKSLNDGETLQLPYHGIFILQTPVGSQKVIL